MTDSYDFDQLWNYSDPAGTGEKFAALLPAARTAGDAEYYVQLLTQIGRTLSLQRKFDEANAHLDTVEPLLSDGTPVARIRYLLERGRTFNSSNKLAQALPLFVEAWAAAQAAGADFFAVDAAHMIAICKSGEEALDWNMRAIEFAEQSAQPRTRGWLGSLYNNTGWTFHDMGEYEKALDLFERALSFRNKQGKAENIRIAKWCIGRCLRSLGRLDEALVIQKALLAEAEAEDAPDGYTHEELGELLLLKGRGDEAAPHFQAAYAVLSEDPWLMANETARMARLKELAERQE